MKVLAIRLARLGDVILLLPALISLKSRFPNSRLTLLTDRRYAPVAELCHAIDEVIAVDRITMRDGPWWRAVGNMAKLVRDIRGRQYDFLIDFHSFRETNLLSWFSGARKRLAIKRYNAPYLAFCFNLPPILEDKQLHVSDMFLRVVEREGEVDTARRTLTVPVRQREWAERAVPPRPRIALYVDAPTPERIWPPENFAAFGDYVARTWGASLLVFSGPGGREQAERVWKASHNRDRLCLFTDVTIPQLASLIASADLFVSNDTGPMHIGPGVGVPTLGLFSVGFPEHFRPAGSSDRFLCGNPINKINVQMVVAAATEMWATADPNLQR